ncbi:response regulator transcription factor [Nocardioides nitrophenolicus]|uniref:response regulator transcription factor n=1 Tax=Nocardioides nitrophenolicus TaxID=60489 RepID=UPI0019592AE0|nr:response regulator transcription factor [Nocardioides nitrophenolicus]MBM7519370.1 DNA-binding NarL/FixJ family response regulator [Nocardioides nitrophenolicus]
MIRVLVADDHELIRRALCDLIASEPGLEVVGEAADGLSAERLAIELLPDVVLMDVRMPGIDGVEATRRIVADPRAGEVKVLVLTTFEQDENVLRSIRAGASGFLGKGADTDALVHAIRTVHDGGNLLSPKATRALIDHLVAPVAPGVPYPGIETLTAREREVLGLIGQGLGNEQIAALLQMSAATARTHVGRLLTKLGAHSRAQLVVVAYESGIRVPGAVRPELG